MVGDLWIGFLDFFARDWDDKKLVVSIRQSRPLTKFEKMWTSPCIAIEDPFELSHNLGAGISRKSNKQIGLCLVVIQNQNIPNFSVNLNIKKAFIKNRNLFGTPICYRLNSYHTIQVFFRVISISIFHN